MGAKAECESDDDVIEGGPAAVKLWAEWWGGCKTVAPVMEELAEEYQGKVKVVGLNVDHAPDTAGTLGVMGIPVIIFFKDGNETGRYIGGKKDKIMEEMDRLL